MRCSIGTLRPCHCHSSHQTFQNSKTATSWTAENFTIDVPCYRLRPREAQSAKVHCKVVTGQMGASGTVMGSARGMVLMGGPHRTIVMEHRRLR
jgi:hypothetical protein